MKIFIATHKKFKNIIPDGKDYKEYIPTQVGIGEELGYFRENQLDNIAHKNKYYCELTLLYFIWKNVTDDIVGLVHYRRYFVKKYFFKKIFGIFLPKVNFIPLNSKDITRILRKYDLIIPRVCYCAEDNVRSNYIQAHYEKDWELTKNITSILYPEYMEAFKKIESGKEFYAYNMFIGKKRVINEYCSWLFPLLFEVEKKINMEGYSEYDKRVFGFLSERLFSVWLEFNKNKFAYCNIRVRMIE